MIGVALETGTEAREPLVEMQSTYRWNKRQRSCLVPCDRSTPGLSLSKTELNSIHCHFLREYNRTSGYAICARSLRYCTTNISAAVYTLHLRLQPVYLLYYHVCTKNIHLNCTDL